MKAIVVATLVFVSSAVWSADWNGANAWNDTSSTQRIWEIGGFTAGYFDTIIDKFPWNEADRNSWVGLIVQTMGFQMLEAMKAFYADPANKDVPPSRAMRMCLESLIAKTKDGPRLLAAIGVKIARQ